MRGTLPIPPGLTSITARLSKKAWWPLESWLQIVPQQRTDVLLEIIADTKIAGSVREHAVRAAGRSRDLSYLQPLLPLLEQSKRKPSAICRAKRPTPPANYSPCRSAEPAEGAGRQAALPHLEAALRRCVLGGRGTQVSHGGQILRTLAVSEPRRTADLLLKLVEDPAADDPRRQQGINLLNNARLCGKNVLDDDATPRLLRIAEDASRRSAKEVCELAVRLMGGIGTSDRRDGDDGRRAARAALVVPRLGPWFPARRGPTCWTSYPTWTPAAPPPCASSWP